MTTREKALKWYREEATISNLIESKPEKRNIESLTGREIQEIYLKYNSEYAGFIKRLFILYFDGSYGVEPHHKTLDTYKMGLCKLEYSNEVLTVHLRRPGLLIGKGGKTIEDLSAYLGCKVHIVEVIF